MKISDLIADFILDSLRDEEGVLEMQRSELAERFRCVPSQINYVISTRFTPENGFFVESRRGGGGYVRITRIKFDRPSAIMHAVNSVGDYISVSMAGAIIRNLYEIDAIDARLAEILTLAVSEASLAPAPVEVRQNVRASIMKNILVNS